jgi:benzoyl-CoA reductase/2-hydroxyglutaryl-CoA dehydratase subunit BcrC/BadD/HgdB
LTLQEKEISAYETEYQSVIGRLKQETPPFKEAEQLLELVQTHFSFAVRRTQHPKVIVLGSGFPEELIYAFGAVPYWGLGGSLQTGTWAGDAAPRDADPVSRSILGLSLGLGNLARDALVLLPIVSDSTRKLAYLLRREGIKVHTIDIPPVKNESALPKYERQLELCVEALSSHTKKRLTQRALRRAAGLVAQAHDEMRRFLQLTEEHPSLLSDSWCMLICFSYYCAGDLAQWTETLARLNDRIKASHTCKPNRTNGSVLLMGSPIYFPNYKIPFLLQDVGLHISAHMDYTMQKARTALTIEETVNITMSDLVKRFYQADCSGSYAKNEQLQAAASELLDSHRIDGVVYCVLKGQIEYDFELERLESQCEQRNIPVFRLETDYNQQDVEQLRIRMEAFSEMLRQRQYQKGVTV